MGTLLAVSVHAANIHDTKSEIPPAEKAFSKHSVLMGFCDEWGYRKTFRKG